MTDSPPSNEHASPEAFPKQASQQRPHIARLEPVAARRKQRIRGNLGGAFHVGTKLGCRFELDAIALCICVAHHTRYPDTARWLPSLVVVQRARQRAERGGL